MSEAIVTDTQTESTSTDSVDVSQDVVNDTVDTQGTDVWDNEDFNMNEPTDIPVDSKVEDTVEVDWNSRYKEQRESGDSKLDKPILIKVKGKVMEIDNLQDIADLAERGTSATQKFQEMAEQRKMLDGVTAEDIQLLRQARDGDVDAMNQLVNKQNVSPEEVQKQDAVYQSEQLATEIISSDYAEQFKEAISLFPESERYNVATNPSFMQGLKNDFDSGTAQKLMPSVQRYMTVNGMEFLEAYARAGKEVLGDTRSKKAEKLSSTPSMSSSVHKEAPVDIWDMDESQWNRINGATRN